MTELLLQAKTKKSYIIIVFLLISILLSSTFSVNSKLILSILVLAAFLWMTEIFPLVVTSFLVLSSLITFGVFTADEAFASFSNSTVFFLLSAFLIGESLKELNLGDCCVYSLLRASKEEAERLVLYLSLFSYLLSCIIQVHIVVILILPVLGRIKSIVSKNYGKAVFPKRLYLSVIWMAIIGSTATFLGGGRVLLAIDLFETLTGSRISVISWTLITVPVSFLLAIFSYYFIKKMYPINKERLHHVFIDFEEEGAPNGFTIEQKNAIIIFITTIIAWIFLSDRFGAATIGLISVSILILSKSVEWVKIVKSVKWDIIFLYGSAICLGEAVHRSDLIDELKVFLGENSILINQFSLSFLATIGTEFLNNAATVGILLPFSGAYISDSTVLLSIVYAITLCAGVGIITPMSSPAMAILYSESGLKLFDLLKPALLIKLLSFLIINIYLLTIF